MNFNRKLLAGALALFAFLLSGSTLRAQGLEVVASATPNPVLVSNSLTYTIFITNRVGFNLTEVFVTNLFSAAGLLTSTSNSLAGTVDTSGNPVVFRINFLDDLAFAKLTLNLSPFAPGSMTNTITVATFGLTNVTTNIVTQVIQPTADLGVTLTNVTTGIFTNDPTVIGLFVTNAGPNTASGIVVTNGLPAGFGLVSVSPATASTSLSGTNLIWNIGTLASGSATQLLATVRPTIAGSFNLSATVSGSVNDTNAANNSVTNSINVIAFLPADLSITVLSQKINRQTGLLEMLVQVLNNAATNVPAVRVLATNLPSNTWLYNAVGTNSGVPFVSYNAPILANSAINLTLEFYRIPRAILTNYVPTYQALPFVSISAPATNGTPVTKALMTTNGFLIEFAATVGKTYTILYSDDGFTTTLAAQPAITAPANRVQWIDSGPPKTISNSPARLYRVREGQ